MKNLKFYSIQAQCKALNISRNSFYHWKSSYQKKLDLRAQLLIKILEIWWDSHCTYGSPRITSVLHSKGILVSQRKVSKEMRVLGIASIHTSKFPHRKSSMNPGEAALIHNLILKLDITHPNQVWTTDITYIHTVYDSTLYLITFIDQFS